MAPRAVQRGGLQRGRPARGADAGARGWSDLFSVGPILEGIGLNVTVWSLPGPGQRRVISAARTWSPTWRPLLAAVRARLKDLARCGSREAVRLHASRAGTAPAPAGTSAARPRLALVCRAVLLPAVEAVPEGRMVDLPGRGSTFVRRRARPAARRADDRAAARAGLHGVPHLVRRARRAVPDPPRRRPRPALARPRHPVAAVPDRRLRRRRRRRCSTSSASTRRSWPATRWAGPSPRWSGTATRERVAGLVLCLDRPQPPRPRGRADVLPGDDAGDAPALPGRAHQGRAGGRDAARAAVGRRSPTPSPGAARSSAAPRRGRCRRCSASSAGSTRRPWIGSVDVPTAVVVTDKDQAIPTRRQRRLAASIEASVVRRPRWPRLGRAPAARWVPVFRQALAEVTRRADFDVDEGDQASVC